MKESEAFKMGRSIADIYTREIEEATCDDPLNHLSGHVLQNHHTLEDQASAVVEMLFLDSDQYAGAYNPDESSCSEAVYSACQGWIMDAVSAYQTHEEDVVAGIRQGLQDIADILEAQCG